jgi:hypothetical protein
MRVWKWVLPLLLLSQSAFAGTNGKHVVCELDGIFQSKSHGNKDAHRVLHFYLDDANAKIQSDDRLTVSTSTYSHALVEATIVDGHLGADTYFGTLLREPAAVSINRTNGQIAVVASFFDGAEVDHGMCDPTKAKANQRF